MSMVYLLIALALVLILLAIWALFWAIGSRQFDDLESQGWSVVLDDDQKPPPLREPAPDSTEPENGDAKKSIDQRVDRQ
jgi:cbb3-type cytochrome oxidase maturation protein